MMIVPLAAAMLLWLLLSQTRSVRRGLRLVMPALPARIVAIALVVLALLTAAHGNLWAALCLFGGSLWSLGRTSRAAATAARASIVGSSANGLRILSGPFAGARVDELDLAGCMSLRADCVANDPAGAVLLEAYLDRRFPGWRPAGHGDADARRRRPRFTNEMTEDQAYQVLGLASGASRADVIRSHRLAMKRWHPDQGGSADQAARANEAKEVLLRGHH